MSDSSNANAISSDNSKGFDGPLESSSIPNNITEVDPQILQSVRSELSAFLRLDMESIHEDTLLLSLGLDSLKAVALSRRLEERGVHILPVDMIRAGTVRRLALSANVAGSSEEVEDETLLARERILSDDLDLNALKLDDKDEVHITMTTALQAGMLSQVRNILKS